MYGWPGIGYDKLKEKYPTILSLASGNMGYGALKIGSITMLNFNGDCGSLILQGCNYATSLDLKRVKDIASNTGHSKLFGTIVVGNKEWYDQQLTIFKKAGFRIIKKSMSNRSPTKYDAVVFYHNPNCKYKGY